MTIEEFIYKSGVAGVSEPEMDTFTVNFTYKTSVRSIPDSWDWSKLGKVSAVGNQGSCRSCWAYSATGVMEGQYAIKYKKLVTLSTQQLIDCMHQGKGCLDSMTFPHIAINSAAKKGGIMPDSEYRYLGFQTACRFDVTRAVARIKNALRYVVTGEEQLRELVYSYGPVAAGFLISSGFPKYRRGIATAENFQCNVRRLLNHSVLIVGFGTAEGVPYWIIKNSHGAHWGEQGYFRLKRGDNPCNLMDYIATVYLL
ncbi:pro-cathepsin H-like [Hyposmocoma kahamanoa]|uniref:pro-cathepsin H-like n=1 Tax=Hyposmocoma kahamanoa TaxID=1477025 RepID=UPI000E6D9193|nr:pro-cathepsin H-like [Hyposmocoma kahamanoa]